MAKAKRNKKQRPPPGGVGGGRTKHHGSDAQGKVLPRRRKVKRKTGQAASGKKPQSRGKPSRKAAKSSKAKKATKPARSVAKKPAQKPAQKPVQAQRGKRTQPPKAKTTKPSKPEPKRSERRVAPSAKAAKVVPKKAPPKKAPSKKAASPKPAPKAQAPKAQAPKAAPAKPSKQAIRLLRQARDEKAKIAAVETKKRKPTKIDRDRSFGGPKKTHDARPGIVKVAMGLRPNPEASRKDNYLINKGKAIFTYFHKAANFGLAENNLLRIYGDVSPTAGEPDRLLVRIRQDDGIDFQKFREAVKFNTQAAQVAGMQASYKTHQNDDGSFDAEIRIVHEGTEDGSFGELVRSFADVASIPNTIT